MRLNTKILIYQTTQARVIQKKESEAREMAKATVFEAMNNPSCGLDIHKDMIEGKCNKRGGRKAAKNLRHDEAIPVCVEGLDIIA